MNYFAHTNNMQISRSNGISSRSGICRGEQLSEHRQFVIRP